MGSRTVLLIQGAGAGAHDEWDIRLADGLRRELGDGHEVRYPRMPAEDDPAPVAWTEAVRRELASLEDGAVVAGHSVGGAILVHAIAERWPERDLAAIVLIAAPYIGEGGWPADGIRPFDDLGARLPAGVPVHVFHGLDDATVPAAHAGLYARAIPQAEIHLLAGRDHQLDDDLTEVARAIRG